MYLSPTLAQEKLRVDIADGSAVKVAAYLELAVQKP